ncbi:MAG TPA: phosphodiester glycosidase family protein [Gemmatimonadales bacterium]|nr:phosphodiester glycosidase family protein [Gemmatimonadales bacterium]
MVRPLLLLFTALGPLVGIEGAPRRPPASLAVRSPEGGWHEWWRADRAPERWSAALPAVARAVDWRPLTPGARWGELRLSGDGEAWRVRVILVQLHPRHVRLRTVSPRRLDGRPPRWSVDSAPPGAIVALNAGQFTSAGPWGWLVSGGEERRAPGSGPLAPALVVDTAGAVRLVPPDSIAPLRGDRAVIEAFQSYPSLLTEDGVIPGALRESGLGVDLEHRDARLALGLDREGRLLIAMTRFEGLGGVLSNLPFGLTTPEMAALMGALGCRRAMLLDGGISSQLRLAPAGGGPQVWRGMRHVPLGLLALPASE